MAEPNNQTDKPAEEKPAPEAAEPTAEAVEPKPAGKPPKGLKAWWGRLHKWAKIGLVAGATVVIAVLVVVLTPLRYPVVGLVHKGQVTLTVVDDTTNQPIPDAQVGIGKTAVTTDKTGQVTLSGLSLGKATITINKNAYVTKTMPITLFWNPARLGNVAIHSNGVLVKFSVTDWISAKPVADAKITVGNASAVTSTSGMASVSLEPEAVAGAKATIAAGGYNNATVAVNKSASVLNPATLVPTGSVYFFSNRSGGSIDLYSANLDGSNQTVVLKGTGNEDTSTGLLPSVNDPNTMAIVSSRAGKHDNNGNLEHDLYIFNGATQSLTQVDSNVQFADFRAWMGTSLVYVKQESDQSFVIAAYDTKAKSNKTLTSVAPSNNTTGYLSVSGLGVYGQNLYYNVAASDASQTGFYSIGLSGGPKQLDSEQVIESYRNAKSSLVLGLATQGVGEVWKQLNFTTNTLATLSGEPSAENNRGYADSPDGSHSVFVETRDGKSQLYLTDGSGNNESAITTSGFVNQFVQWYNNQYVAYSTNAQGGSSISIVSINGGPERKIADFFQGNGRTYGGGYNPNYF